MSRQEQMIRLIRSISGQANILTIPRIYIKLTKSHRAALLLSQCVYWGARGHRGDGWFYKSFREWRDELGLQQHAVETAVKTLKKKGYLDTEIGRGAGLSMTTWYRVNLEKLASDLAETDISVSAKSTKRKTISPSYSSKTTTLRDSEKNHPIDNSHLSAEDGYIDFRGNPL